MSLHNNGRPADLVQYTLATLPDAADHVGSMAYVTDATSGSYTGAVVVAKGTEAGSPLGTAVWVDLSTGAEVA